MNTQGHENDIVLLMTLMLNINRPQAIEGVPKMSSEDFNTLLCLPSLFKKLSKNVEILDSVDVWEERNKQIASEKQAIKKISQILTANFDPEELKQALIVTPSPDNPYYKQLEVVAEEYNIPLKKLLSKNPRVVVKFGGNVEELSKKMLDSKLADYEVYKKFVSGDKELINNFWLEEPLESSLNVEINID